MNKTISEIADIISGKVVGDGTQIITDITNIETPLDGCIAFIQAPKDLRKVKDTGLTCVIVPEGLEVPGKTTIEVAHPKIAWAQLLPLFHPVPEITSGISEQAIISPTAQIGNNVTIEACVRICDSAVIEDNAVLRSGAFISENVKIGANSMIYPNVTIYHSCILGENVIVHAGTVIGTDGFGYVATPEKQIKVPQVGNVIIEDDVEIGANVTIDRATIGSTVIGKDCKIDNMVQIAHNVVIGPHTAISSQTGISGSSKIGSHVTMGGKVGVGDHVEIGDWVMVGAGAGFPSGKKVPGQQIVFGEPARPYAQARKQIAAQLRSAETYQELKVLREKVAALEKQFEEEPKEV